MICSWLVKYYMKWRFLPIIPSFCVVMNITLLLCPCCCQSRKWRKYGKEGMSRGVQFHLFDYCYHGWYMWGRLLQTSPGWPIRYTGGSCKLVLDLCMWPIMMMMTTTRTTTATTVMMIAVSSMEHWYRERPPLRLPGCFHHFPVHAVVNRGF